nr:DUF2199 domain-containing protein [Nocardioides sp. 616]
MCGRPGESHDRHVRFRLPDPVVRLPEQERTAGTWMSEPDPERAVMMQVPALGAFVRALLPVRLSGGHTVTFGLWVGIHPEDLQRAFDVWWAPEYRDLHIHGRLANALPNWEVFGVPVSLAVTDPDATPYCVDSEDGELRSVITNEWDHEVILAALPD